MINLYSMQFGLLATLGSIGIQAALFFTMVIFVRPEKDMCPFNADLGGKIYADQVSLFWTFLIFHFLVALILALRERNDDVDLNLYFEIALVTLNIIQIGLLCKTMQEIFVEQASIYEACLGDQAVKEMPLGYQKFQVWLVIEAGLIFSIIITNGLFLVLRALVTQKGKLKNNNISKTHTEETDYIVAHQFLIGYVNNLTVPLLMGFILDIMVRQDANTNITDNSSGVIEAMRSHFSWMQWFEFVSAYVFVFVSYFNAPSWISKSLYLTVMPKLFFVVFILLDCISIPVTEWTLLFWHDNALDQSGYAHYFHLCGLLQLAFVILVAYQLH